MILLLVRESGSRILERVHDSSPRFAKPRAPTTGRGWPNFYKVRFF